jgi:RNA polymerase sigma-70 factor, ECF subfamily
VGTVAGRDERFTALLEAVAGDVRRYLVRRAGEQLAEEVLAEVAVVLWRRLDDVPAEEPLPWCYAVARRCLANALRGERRRAALLERLTRELGRDGPADRSSPVEARLADALATLKDGDREVLTLWAWEGLEPRQLATTLEISANAAAIRLHRARRRLAEACAEAERVDALADTEAGDRRMR